MATSTTNKRGKKYEVQQVTPDHGNSPTYSPQFDSIGRMTMLGGASPSARAAYLAMAALTLHTWGGGARGIGGIGGCGVGVWGEVGEHSRRWQSANKKRRNSFHVSSSFSSATTGMRCPGHHLVHSASHAGAMDVGQITATVLTTGASPAARSGTIRSAMDPNAVHDCV